MKRSIPENPTEVFRGQLESWGIDVGQKGLEKLASYAEELAVYDKANVVGTREIGELWLDHVLDSLSCLLYGPLEEAASLVDVGTGGGMPGIPLHLTVGFQRACLLESTGKKAEFLRYVSSRLAIEALEIANHRAEEVAHSPDFRARFEAATVRAVAPLDVISEYCVPLLSPGGTMVAMKGRIDSDELRDGERAASLLGGEIEAVIRVPYSPEMQTKERHLVIVKKVRPTPDRYPRNPGTPRKSPLGSAA